MVEEKLIALLADELWMYSLNIWVLLGLFFIVFFFCLFNHKKKIHFNQFPQKSEKKKIADVQNWLKWISSVLVLSDLASQGLLFQFLFFFILTLELCYTKCENLRHSTEKIFWPQGRPGLGLMVKARHAAITSLDSPPPDPSCQAGHERLPQLEPWLCYCLFLYQYQR